MKETITLKPTDGKDKIILPIDYNHMVQAMIYNQLDEEVAEFLHEEGFQKQKRVYKLFTFSRLTGSYKLDRQNKLIKFNGPIKLTISSPYDEFSNSIGNSILSSKNIRLGSNRLEIKELIVEKEVIHDNAITIETMSPITTYSTLFRRDGKKFTYYFNPREQEFSEIISNNLKNKYKAFYGEEPPREDIIIKAVGDTRMSIINYKNFIIKGYMGRFRMKGPRELLQLGIDAGIGSKNSQGFGCVKVL